MTFRAEQLKITAQMFAPIPTNATRPRHELVRRSLRNDTVELQVFDLTALDTLATKFLHEFGPGLARPDRTQTTNKNRTRHYFRLRFAARH